MKRLIVSLFLFAVSVPAQSVWRTAYIEDPTAPTAANFPYNYYTHIIMVGFNCNGSGALFNQFGYPTNLWPGFRTNATAAGVKVLLFIGGDMTSCTNSTNLASYITKIKNTTLGTDTSLNTGGVVFDGVDLDWESGIGTGSITAYENLISGLRTALGPTKIIEMAGWRASFFQSIAVNQQANLDRFQNEMYDATSGASNGASQLWSWYNLAVHNLDSPANFSGSADGGFNGLVAAGFPAAKINEGIPYYGYLYTGCTHSEVVGCTSVSGTQFSYASIVGNSTWNAAPHLNDSRNGSDYISLTGTNQYVTYSDVTSIGQLVSWGKSVGLGGYFVWTQAREYLPAGTTQAQKFPLSAALFAAATSAPSAPRSFFVSFSGGNDANDGLTVGTPWKTFAKVTAGPTGGYIPDDKVLFKRGDTWTGGFIATQASGTSGHQIHYGSYGTGTLPILDANGSSEVFRVAHDYITIENLQMRNTTSSLVNFAGQIGTQILNTVSKNGGGHVFFGGAKNGTTLTGTTTIVGNTYTVDAGKSSSLNQIEVHTDNHANPPKIIITDNYVDRSTASGALNGSCIIVAGGINSVLDRNVCIAGTQGIGVKPYERPSDNANCQAGDLQTSGGSIQDNYISLISVANGDGESIELEGCSHTIPQTGFTVARNIIICNPTNAPGIGGSDAIGTFFTHDTDIFGNIAIGGCGLASGTTIPRMFALGSAQNLRVYNNTLVGNGGVGTTGNGSAYAAVSFNASTGITFENNIIKNFPRGLESFSASTSISEDYNIFDTDVITLRTGAMTAGSHDLVNTHPGFVSNSPALAGDVKLTPGSPAIGAGFALGSPYNLILNSLPPAFPYGKYDQAAGVWMIGAFGPTSVAAGQTYKILGAKMSGAKTP